MEKVNFYKSTNYLDLYTKHCHLTTEHEDDYEFCSELSAFDILIYQTLANIYEIIENSDEYKVTIYSIAKFMRKELGTKQKLFKERIKKSIERLNSVVTSEKDCGDKIPLLRFDIENGKFHCKPLILDTKDLQRVSLPKKFLFVNDNGSEEKNKLAFALAMTLDFEKKQSQKITLQKIFDSVGLKKVKNNTVRNKFIKNLCEILKAEKYIQDYKITRKHEEFNQGIRAFLEISY